ncbi:MAG: hypothetical protein HZA54_09040 [Planctomycetes bacterium]|nr:hypothetical protein [Planctomycetota bacterium]
MAHPQIDLHRALEALGERLDAAGAPPFEVAVCGGAALILQGLADRKTGDVDVLGQLVRRTDGVGELHKWSRLPDLLRAEVQRVAQDLGLDSKAAPWFNLGPAGLLDCPLPEGMVGRLHPMRFGKSLVLHLLDRQDLLVFKVWACTDRAAKPQHFEDLQQLRPSAQELEAAGRAALAFSPWPLNHERIQELLTRLGHGDVALRIPRPA